jgi:hypothetical protein
MSLNLFLLVIELSDLMSWLGKLRIGKSKEETKSQQAVKPRIYFATNSGIVDNGTGGGLLEYWSKITKDRNTVLDKLGNELKTQGFSYCPSIGLNFQGENKEDAKNKLLNQKNNKISKDIIETLEKKWIEQEKPKEAEKKEEKELDLEKYKISEKMKAKLLEKTGIEVEYGINVDYEKAVESLREWKRFES